MNRVFVFAAVLLLVTSVLYYTTVTSNVGLQAKKHGVKHLAPHPTAPSTTTGVMPPLFPLAGHAGAAATAATVAALKSPAFVVQPPAGTETTLPVSRTNDTAAALAIAHRLAGVAATIPRTDPSKCLPKLDHINAEKEARFTVINPCVTVSGTVTWTHYFNDDGDANFNIALDTPYKDMLTPGSYSNVFASKYPGGPAMHMEVICQSIVTSRSSLNTGACDDYTGPIYGLKHLPKIGQHVTVTGRYLTEMPEMPGGITELHPVYAIKNTAPPGKLIEVR